MTYGTETWSLTHHQPINVPTAGATGLPYGWKREIVPYGNPLGRPMFSSGRPSADDDDVAATRDLRLLRNNWKDLLRQMDIRNFFEKGTTREKRKKGRDSSSGGSDENDNHDKTHVMPRSLHANIGQAAHSPAEPVNISVADYSSL
ncbi:hypothetical protein evm_001938 [Chilo suppressalis]|nr:hypothetical protein evm_001938 [Chilo suppressalis]